MRIALCDDNQHHLGHLLKLLTRYLKSKQIEAEIFSYESGVQLLLNTDLKFDMIFLDINMPDIDGLAAARKIREKNNKVFIVFVTSHMEYSLSGYEVKAFRYIMKDQLDGVFETTMEAFLKERNPVSHARLIKFIEGDFLIKFDELIYVESEKHKLLLHFESSSHKLLQMYDKLDDFEKTLNNSLFVRVHKSYLVNMRYISRIRNYTVELKDKHFIPIPKPRYSSVKESFVLFKGEL